MKSEISQRVNHELVDRWHSRVLNVWPLDRAVTFERICAELSRRAWGEQVIAHLYNLTLLDTDASRYVSVCQYPHDVDTWAATMWGLHQLGYTELVEMFRDCTNTPAQVRCPACGKFMRQAYDKSYTNVQGIEEFRHGCRMFRNKAIRLFRYVPDHGWCETGITQRKPRFDKATKDKIEEILWRVINASAQQAETADFSCAAERYVAACKAKNEIYEILGMKEYKYDV